MRVARGNVNNGQRNDLTSKDHFEESLNRLDQIINGNGTLAAKSKARKEAAWLKLEINFLVQSGREDLRDLLEHNVIKALNL